MRRKLVLCSTLAAVVLAVYWPGRHYDFVCYDDPEFVAQNPQVQAGLTWPTIRYALSSVVVQNWHPVTVLSHVLDCQVFGVKAGAMHLVNVALHAANALLLFVVLSRMTRAFWPSAVTAGLFALHPPRVESVAWISERKDVLSVFFMLLTLWAYARYVEGLGARKATISPAVQKPEEEGGPAALQPAPGLGQSLPWYCLAVCFFALGLMSKPMLVTLPCVLLLLDFWPLCRLGTKTGGPDFRAVRSLVMEKWPFFALAAVFCWITIRVEGPEGGVESLGEISLGERASNSIVSYLRYPAKLFWPTDLAVIYPHPACH